MKYVLVDKYNNVVSSVELGSNVGISGAQTYFKGVKKLPKDKDLDKLYRVKTEKEHKLNMQAFERKPSSQSYGIEWWKEETSNLDIERE